MGVTAAGLKLGATLIGGAAAAGGAVSQRRAQKAAQKQAKEQEEAIAKQTDIEKGRLGKEASEVAKRKAGAISGRTGRRSLIGTTQAGLATNLGGTAGG